MERPCAIPLVSFPPNIPPSRLEEDGGVLKQFENVKIIIHLNRMTPIF